MAIRQCEFVAGETTSELTDLTSLYLANSIQCVVPDIARV